MYPRFYMKDDWRRLPNPRRRQAQLDILSESLAQGAWNGETGKPSVLLMIQGTRKEDIPQICELGFGIQCETDDGFYGRGMYFTSNLPYAACYSQVSRSGLGKPFLLSPVIPGNPFPVIEDPYSRSLNDEGQFPNPRGYLGKACCAGYQSHHVLVNRQNPRFSLPATDLVDGSFVDELVTFESAQALPLFVFYMA